ncbi:S9 family peptidase [Flavisolibacter sp. BT320]|nr:S9 family peptidase [Flavisolibacter longurius]
MKKTIVLLFCSFCTLLIFAQNGTGLIEVTDLLKIRTAGNIAVSENGNKAAFTLTTIEPSPTSKLDYRYLTQVYLVDMAKNSKPVQVTHAKESASSPVWSPDGSRLAFVRTVEGRPQIFILPMNGGEAWQLTTGNRGASNPKWSPDGSRIVFSSSISFKDLVKDSLLNPSGGYPIWPLEKPGLTTADIKRAALARPDPNGNTDQIRAYLLANEADGKATVLNKLNFQDEANISSNMSFAQFYTIDVKPVAQAKPILTGFARYSAVEFTPDGKYLILAARMDSLEHPDRTLESEIYLADADGKNVRQLLGKKGMTYGNALVSPSGKWLAYQYGTLEVDVPSLAIMPFAGKESDAITIPFDRNKGGLTWSADEKALYFTAQSNGGSPLYRLNLATKKIEQLSAFDAGITSFGLGKNGILFSKTEVTNPSEIYFADVALKEPIQLSAFNSWVKEKKLSLPVKNTFVNNKGLTVEYWVMKPTNFEAGKKYPLLLEIHGGPSAMWGPSEASMWHEFQFFAAKGYGVVYSNPRGSGGYGTDFLRANINDWGAGPTSDVLTALDKAVGEGWADTAKLAITGGSYAGYLTAWIISHDKRFKAACAQRGVYDLSTFFGEGNAWRLVPRYFGGYPWEPQVRTVLQRESPINYVQNITTPFIIFHGDNDRRTGFVQSEMLFRSLKVLNRPVEYVRHPGATHEITRSGDNRQRIDQMLRTYEFFQRWIK